LSRTLAAEVGLIGHGFASGSTCRIADTSIATSRHDHRLRLYLWLWLGRLLLTLHTGTVTIVCAEAALVFLSVNVHAAGKPLGVIVVVLDGVVLNRAVGLAAVPAGGHVGLVLGPVIVIVHGRSGSNTTRDTSMLSDGTVPVRDHWRQSCACANVLQCGMREP